MSGYEKWDECEWKRKMGLHACADGEWDGKHVIAFVGWDVKCCGMERWKWNVEWSETCSSSWERTCNFFQNGEKIEMQTSKTQKQAHAFDKRLKHVKMQCTSTCNFEFGVWGNSKSVKIRVFILFKGKMHFSWHIYGQMGNFKLKYAWK